MTTGETRAMLVQVLRDNRNPDGTIPNRLVRPVADRVGVNPRTVRRWLAADVAKPRAFTPSDEHIDALYACSGNIHAAYEVCLEEGFLISHKEDPVDGISERTFRRGFKQRVDVAIVRAAKHGWSGFVSTRAYGKKHIPEKGHTYATDSSPMNLLVRESVTSDKVIDLYETNVIDEFSRFALAVSTTNGHPDTEVSVAILAAAIGGYDADDGTHLGGMPDHVLSDQGSEYKSQPVTTGLVRLGFIKAATEETPEETSGAGIKRRFSEPESGWTNGIDEAFHKTLQRGFSSKYPGYISTDLSTFDQLKLREHWKKNPRGLLTRDQVDALLQRWLMRYNFETAHSGIDGMTPFEKWKSDNRLLPRPSEEAMSLAMLSDGTRVVDKGKVRAFSTTYHHPALGEHHGHRVDIRYLPGRPETIKVFYLDQLLGDAKREDLLDDNYHGGLIAKRDKQTEVHLGHSLSGERLKTARAVRELKALGFDDDSMPTEPTEAMNAHKLLRRKHGEPRIPVSSTEEQEALAAIVPTTTSTDTPDTPAGVDHYDEEFIA